MQRRTVLITGASRGIGKALTQKFLENGDFVIGTSTSGQCDLIDKNLLMVKLDLSDPASIVECTENISNLHKSIDVLINNAGIWMGYEDEIVRMENVRKVLEVNLIGTIDFTEHLLDLLVPGAHIINVSSSGGSMQHTHHANYPEYKISKAGLNMYTRILSERLKDKVIVSSVHPGWVRTNMGGSDADISPEEAAEHIFKLADSRVESGQFWFKDQKFPW